MDKVMIIAEAGVNHNGSLKLAKKLIDVAKKAGADYVKFQTFKAKNIASKNAGKAAYQKKTTGKGGSQQAMLQKLELNESDHQKLISYCKKKSIKFLSTPFDLDSIFLLKKMGIKIGKIPSGEITNLPYLQQMAVAFEELILSTGMSNLEEVEQALNILIKAGAKKEKITVLHCTTEYPTPMNDVNLNAMVTMKKKLGVQTGYSDHTRGIEVAVAAVALGAIIIEKHFTLDRNMRGPDHKASLEPNELKEMVTAIRNIERALGNGIKKPSLSEQRNIKVARKSLIAAKNMEVGHLIQKKDIDIKRPGNGISPMMIDEIMGKKLVKAIREDELLTPEHFQ
jgi:N,N'-diacetyllegionaminate synthase